MTQINFAKDVQGFNTYAPMTSSLKYSATITTGSATSIIVPNTFENWIVAFSYEPGANVWVDFSGATAAVPVGATLAATTSELLPAARYVQAGTNVSIITDNTSCDVGVMLYVAP